MCMMAVAVAATIASTAMSVMGSIQQGQAAKAQANYQAQVADNNAKIAEWQAKDATKRGQIEEDAHRRQVQKFIGSQRAQIGASGFDLGDEVALGTFGDTAAMGELDALTIRQNAAREAWGYRVQGSNYTADAGLMRARGSAAQTASYWQAGGDLMNGASKFATSYNAAAKQYGWGGS